MAEKTLFASSSVLPLLSLVFLVFFIAGSSHIVNGDNLPEVEAARPGKLEVPLVHLLQNSPGSKPGQAMYGNRVQIRGLSRLRNLNKYSHLLKVKVALQPESRADRPPPLMNVEVCLHRNASIEMGMCAPSEWVRLVKGLWTRPVSPFSDRFLDIRMPGLSSKTIEVSVEEEFAFHRLVFLVLGMMMMMLARPLSVFVGFYYSSAMFAGVILVALIVLFQGMKLLPTGRKGSLAIFLYSSLVGMASFLLSYLSGFLRSLLVEMGIGEDLFYPLAIFLLLFLVLAGAWFGFWGVRKFVLTEDGSVDENVASFVEWSIYIFASVMIFQSSLDRLFAAEALAFWIVISAVTKRISWPQVLHPLNMPAFSTPERIWQRSDNQDSTYNIDHTGRHMHETRNFSTPKNKSTRLRSHIRDSPQKNDLSGDVYETWNPDSFQTKIRSYTPNSRSSPIQGIDRTPSQYSSDQDMYYSSFHKTTDRKRFSKKEWEEFTQDSTKKALQDLVSTPDFSEWAIAHADRITLTPSADRNSATNQQKRRWFHWF